MPSKVPGEISDVKLTWSFFFFQEGIYIHNSVLPLKRKNNLSKHMDAKSVPLILFYTIWHSEILEDK